MSALTLTLRYVLGSGWYIIAWSDGVPNERRLAGPLAGVQEAIDERLKLAVAFDQDGAVAS